MNLIMPLNILKNSQNIEYIYKEIDCLHEYHQCINENQSIDFIVYNYHTATMNWLNNENIQRIVKNIGIPHESPEHLFDIVCSAFIYFLDLNYYLNNNLSQKICK